MKVLKVWEAYEYLLLQPSTRGKARIAVGSMLYLSMTAVAILLISQWLADSGKTTYVNFKRDSERPKIAPLHRMPDVVMCPESLKVQKYAYTANYNYWFVEKVLGMSVGDVNDLTKKFYDLCQSNEDCRLMDEPCAGTKFDSYCKKLGDLHARHTVKNKTMRHLKYRVLGEELERNGGQWSLQMLFTSLISMSMSYLLTGSDNSSLTGSEKSPTSCHIYHLKPGSVRLAADKERMAECNGKANRLAWAGKTLCSLKFGMAVKETTSPYIGIFPSMREISRTHERGGGKYWMGSLESTLLTLESMTSLYPEKAGSAYQDMARISGVVNYSPIKYIDETGMTMPECVEQPVLRGVEIPCTRKRTRVTWYYRFGFARKLRTLWIYPKTLNTYTRRLTLSPYSTFQLAAGFLGGILGLSILKIIGLLRRGILLATKKAEKPMEVIQLISFILLISATIGMTVYDLLIFAENRYADVFLSKDSDLPLPRMTLCSDRSGQVAPSLINITKMYAHKLSPDLFTYLDRAVFHRKTPVLLRLWQKYRNGTKEIEGVSPIFPWKVQNWGLQLVKVPDFVPISYMENFRHPNGRRYYMIFEDPLTFFRARIENKYSPRGYNKSFAHKYFKQLEKEAERLFQDIGLGPDPTTDRVYSYFSIDPSAILKRCVVWGVDIKNCGQYAHVDTVTKHSLQCLIIELPDNVPSKEKSLGPENGIIIEIDPQKYFRESNWQGYYGPGLEDKIAKYYDYTHCKTPETSYKRLLKQRNGKIWGISRSGRCQRPNSWQLKMEHPLWSDSELIVRLARDVLIKPRTYAVEIKESFKKLLSKPGQPCVLREEAVCTYPKLDAFKLAKALRTEEMCDCSACFPGDAKSLDVLHAASEILGKETHCCTVKEHYDCLLRMQDQSEWNEKSLAFQGKYIDNYMIRYFIPYIEVFDDIEKWAAVTRKDVVAKNRFFLSNESLSEEVFDRLKSFLTRCFTPACSQQYIELVNQQEQETTSKNDPVTFKIFYGARASAGREEEDRLSVAEITMAAVCGMSVTFGFSALGIFEVVLLLIKPDLAPAGRSSLKERIHSSWLRSFGIRLVQSSKKPENAVADVRRRERADDSPDQTIKQPEMKPTSLQRKTNLMHEAETFEEAINDPRGHLESSFEKNKVHQASDSAVPQEESEMSEMGNQPGPSTSQDNRLDQKKISGTFPNDEAEKTTENESSQAENSRNISAVPQEESEVSEMGSQPGPSTSQEKDEAGKTTENESSQAENSQSINSSREVIKGNSSSEDSTVKDTQRARILVAALIVVVLVMISMLLALFLQGINIMSTATVSNQEVYQPPSVLLCVQSQQQFQRLEAAVRGAKCFEGQTHQSVSCSAFFGTFLSTTVSGVTQCCLLYDRSRDFKKLENHIPDLKIENFPNDLEVYVSALGLNGTDLEILQAYNLWDKSIMKIEYTVSKRLRGELAPESRIESDCEKCITMYSLKPPPYLCCIKANIEAPQIFGSYTSDGFDFNVGIATKRTGAKYKRLIIQAGDNNVITYQTVNKFDLLTVFSVVSGFMSFFMGLTWLNLVSLVVAWAIVAAQKIFSRTSLWIKPNPQRGAE